MSWQREEARSGTNLRLRFEGDIDGREKGLNLVCEEIGCGMDEDGLSVILRRRKGDIAVSYDGEKAVLEFERDIHLFRALGLLVQNMASGYAFSISETPQFDMNGVMFDVSRNAVLKVDTIKAILRKMALMGLDTLFLYTEDTYQIEGYPYFGYMRGRYSIDELKECDDYAHSLGIEMVPCIQTLGHLWNALKWDAFAHLRDTEDILLAGYEGTYEFIEEMIKAASAPFRSNRIHIGMDEAHTLGLGRYLQLNGYKRRFDIMVEHLRRVCEITSKLGLKPMMWGDMFFRLGSKVGAYYDPDSVIPDYVPESIPEEIQLIYWDYYHKEKEFYAEWIERHRSLGEEPIFAGGIWTWGTFGTNYGNTFLNTNAALKACKENGVREVFATAWNDDGAETNYLTTLLGLQLFAEHGYAEELDMERLKARFEFCTGASYEAFMDLKYIDEIPSVPTDNPEAVTPSKYLLWQDLLIGLFDLHVKEIPAAKHYKDMAARFRKHIEDNPDWSVVFEVPERLCEVLSLKADMGIRITEYYLQKDTAGLGKLVDEDIPLLLQKLNALREKHREQWFRTNKPFGWEVLDIRYGGLYARIESAKWRLQDYLEGRIESIPELEEERLSFNGTEVPKLFHYPWYKRIVTAGGF